MGSFMWILGAAIIGVVIFRIGLGMLRSLGAPIAPPPTPGEMRKVNLRFRCSICGTEVKMTAANDEMPQPPRHCLEDMDLVAPIE